MATTRKRPHPLTLLTLDEASRHLRRSVRQVEALIAEGKLRAFYFGDNNEVVRVLRLDVAQFLKRNS